MDSQTHTHPPNRALNCESLICAWGAILLLTYRRRSWPRHLGIWFRRALRKAQPFFLVFTVWNSCVGKFNSELCLHKNQHKMLPTLVQPT